MGGFDQGWQYGAELAKHSNAVKEAARAAQKNQLGALYLDSINTPLPKVINDPNDPGYESSKQAYQDALGKRQALMQQYVGLNDPVQHATFAQHLHGLIFGQPEPAQPAFGNAPQPEAPTSDANSGQMQSVSPEGADMHPFAPHPALSPIMDGIKTLGNHLKAAVNPVLPPKPQRDLSLLASTYSSPEELKREDAQAAVAGKIAEIQAKPKIGFPQFLESYSNDKGLDSSSLTPAQLQEAHEQYGKSTRAPRWTTVIVADPDSPTKFSKATIDQESGETVSLAPGAIPPRGFIPTKRVTSSVDQYGNVTHTTSQLTPEIAGVNATPAPSAATVAPPTNTVPLTLAQINQQAIAAKGNKGKPISRQVPVSANAPQMPAQLDANGQIPEGVGNPQVREFAQQLLDERDVDKIPPKARAQAAAMARQYGWEQGKFTPREMNQLTEARSILDDFKSNPSLLSVYDSGALNRSKIASLLTDPTKRGVVGSLLTSAASAGLTDAEQRFIQEFNQTVGRIQALGQLTRGGRGATEAAIHRMMSELPYPSTTNSSAAAKHSFDMIQNELDIATQKKQWNASSQKPAPVSSQAPRLPGPSKEIVVTAEDMKK